MQARLPIAVQCYRSHDPQTGILGVMLLINDHLQGKALAAANREGEGATGRARRSAPGSLSTQYNVCGTPGCRCKATPPEKHGPYYQVSFTRKGKSSSKFVRKEDLATIRRELKNYEAMKTLVDQLDRSGYRTIQPPPGQQAPLTERRTWHFPVQNESEELSHVLPR